MTLNAQMTKHAHNISAEILAMMPIHVENQQNVKPKVTEQFASVQLVGEVIHQLNVSSVGFHQSHLFSRVILALNSHSLISISNF